MIKWGKFILAVVGFLLFGAFGAIVGFLLGLILEKIIEKLQKPAFTKISPEQLEQVRSEFFSTTFSVMGFIASIANNTLEKVRRGDTSLVARRVMDRIGLPEHRRRIAMEFFDDGQTPDFALHNTVAKFQRIHSNNPELLDMFVELQLYASYSKGSISPEERDTLMAISYQLGMSNTDFERLEKLVKADMKFDGGPKKGKKKRVKHFALKEAYAVLDTRSEASDDEIKRAYRRLANKYHPDKLAAEDMPEDVLRLAQDKTREIRDAYERIRAVRNF